MEGQDEKGRMKQVFAEVSEMTRKPRPDGTFVILWPEDHNGAFSDIPVLAENIRKTGVSVVVIGDGKTELSLDNVEQRLNAVKGPATLYIAAHGSNNSDVSSHVIGGVNYGNSYPSFFSGGLWDDHFLGRLKDGNGLVSSAALFSKIPSNFNTVMEASCFSAAAVQDAARYLPKGTLFLPFSSSDQSGYGDNGNFASSASNAFSDGFTPLYSSELYYGMLASLNAPNKTSAFNLRAGLETDEKSDRIQNNFPDFIAVGGGYVFDMKKSMSELTNATSSDKTINSFLNKYDYLQDQSLNHLMYDRTTGDSSLAVRRNIMREMITEIEEGKMTPDNKYYVLAQAYTFHRYAEFSSFGLKDPQIANFQSDAEQKRGIELKAEIADYSERALARLPERSGPSLSLSQ